MTPTTPEKDYAEELYDRIMEYCEAVHDMIGQTLTDEQLEEYKENYPDSPMQYAADNSIDQLFQFIKVHDLQLKSDVLAIHAKYTQ